LTSKFIWNTCGAPTVWGPCLAEYVQTFFNSALSNTQHLKECSSIQTIEAAVVPVDLLHTFSRGTFVPSASKTEC